MKKTINIFFYIILLIITSVSLSSCLSSEQKSEIQREAILVELDNLKEEVENLEVEDLESQKDLLILQIEILESKLE